MFPRIYAAQNMLEAEVVISFLRAMGFHPSDLEMSPHVTVAGAEQSYFVRVPPEEAESAREVLKTNGHSHVII